MPVKKKPVVAAPRSRLKKAPRSRPKKASRAKAKPASRPKKSAKPIHRLIVLNPKTGKPRRSVKKGQPVIFAVVGTKGGIKPLQKIPQPFLKSDAKAIAREVARSRDFVLYEQTIAKGGKKLTGRHRARKQMEILYKADKRLRGLALKHSAHPYELAIARRAITMAEPNAVQATQVVLKGKTIKEAISGLHVNVTEKELKSKKFRLFYSVILKIRNADGSESIIPVNASYHYDGFSKSPQFLYHPDFGRHVALKNELKKPDYEFKGKRVTGRMVLADLHSHMATAMRQAFKSAGLTFTRLATLKKIASLESQRIDRMKDADESGENHNKIARAENSWDRILRPSPGSFANDLREIPTSSIVTMYVQFERNP